MTGSGFIVLAATLSSVGTLPVEGIALILGVDRFMSEGRALTNLIGNGCCDRGRLPVGKCGRRGPDEPATQSGDRGRGGRARVPRRVSGAVRIDSNSRNRDFARQSPALSHSKFNLRQRAL